MTVLWKNISQDYCEVHIIHKKKDIREIIFKNQNINKYEVEVALSALSQYCTDIDLLFLKNARDDTLFQSLRDSVVLEKERKVTKKGIQHQTFYRIIRN